MNSIISIWNKIREEHSNELYIMFDNENEIILIKELKTHKVIKKIGY